MNKVRDMVIEARGVARWPKLRTVEGDISITGLLRQRRGWPDALNRPSQAPVRPDRVVIERTNGTKLKSRLNSHEAFHGHRAESGRDELRLVRFAGLPGS